MALTPHLLSNGILAKLHGWLGRMCKRLQRNEFSPATVLPEVWPFCHVQYYNFVSRTPRLLSGRFFQTCVYIQAVSAEGLKDFWFRLLVNFSKKILLQKHLSCNDFYLIRAMFFFNFCKKNVVALTRHLLSGGLLSCLHIWQGNMYKWSLTGDISRS